MPEILQNQQLSRDFFLLKAKLAQNSSAPGQFFMLRAWENYPVLSRPISVFDSDADSVSFLYKVAGEGTHIFSKLKPGDNIELAGPYGNGFPDITGEKLALIGGGVGIAPLYFAAKRYNTLNSGMNAEVFLGFSDEALLMKEFEQVAGRVTVNIGGYITDSLNPSDYGCIIACGPLAMLKALYDKCALNNMADSLYVSMESRMACGIGACLVCTCKTRAGNKKICKDGPVFKAAEVFGI